MKLSEYKLPLAVGTAGLVLCLLPLHLTMTGLCLLLLAAGGAAVIWLKRGDRLPRLRQALIWTMTLCVALLTVATSQIALCGYAEQAPRENGWAIVLGAHVEPGGMPSMILQERLNAALTFHEAHPEIPLILSGGKGDDEPIEEAEAMYAYLERSGADMNGVYRETEAHTTLENLRFGRRIAEELGRDGETVTILTSEYHMCRAVYLAKRLGMEPCTVSSTTRDAFFRLNYELREVFSMVKAWAQTRAVDEPSGM